MANSVWCKSRQVPANLVTAKRKRQTRLTCPLIWLIHLRRCSRTQTKIRITLTRSRWAMMRTQLFYSEWTLKCLSPEVSCLPHDSLYQLIETVRRLAFECRRLFESFISAPTASRYANFEHNPALLVCLIDFSVFCRTITDANYFLRCLHD